MNNLTTRKIVLGTADGTCADVQRAGHRRRGRRLQSPAVIASLYEHPTAGREVPSDFVFKIVDADDDETVTADQRFYDYPFSDTWQAKSSK